MRRPKRGEIWFYLSKNKISGSMQNGARPVLVISNDICNSFSPVIQVIPCTASVKRNQPTHVLFTMNGIYNTLLVEQIQPAYIDDFSNYMRTLEPYLMQQVCTALLIQLGIEEIKEGEDYGTYTKRDVTDPERLFGSTGEVSGEASQGEDTVK